MNSGAETTTKRAEDSALSEPPVHIARWGDIERAHGIPSAQRHDPVTEIDSWAAPGGDADALCGFEIARGGMFWGQAASNRAVRADPSRFELMPMCGDCVRVFATEAITDGTGAMEATE